MRTFKAYRPNPPESYIEAGTAAPVDQAQFEGCEFTDGTVVIRWLTEFRSHSVWANIEDLLHVHGHPDYGSYLVWDGDETQPQAVATRGPGGRLRLGGAS